MNPLKRAYIDRKEVERVNQEYHRLWIEGNKTVRSAFPARDQVEALRMIRKTHAAIYENEIIFTNETYQVNVRKVGDMYHLSIKRRDRQPIHDWRDLQEIKNQILGPECEAVELYPAESRKVDTANQYHLWGSNNPLIRLPFGFNIGRIISDESLGGSVNRPFEAKELEQSELKKE